jgi:hypothetical protein
MAMVDRRGNRVFSIREANPVPQRQLTMGEITQAEQGPSYTLTWFQDTWIKGIGGHNWQDTEDRGKLQSALQIETYPRGTLRPAREVRVSTVNTAPTSYLPSGFAVAPSDTAPGTGFETELWSFQGREPYSGGDNNWVKETAPQANSTYYRNGTAFDKWVVVPGWWGGTDMDDVAMPYAYKARTETGWTASTITAGRFKYFAVAKNNANVDTLWGGNHVFDTGFTLDGSHTNSVTTITANSDPSAAISVGNIIICGVGGDAEQEPMLVTALSGVSITVIRAYGDTAVTYEGGEKIHVFSPHGIKSSSDPSNAGSWSTITTFGEQEYPITGLTVEEDSDTLLIAKTDGLWQQYYESTREGGRLFQRNLTIQFRNQGHPNNFFGVYNYAPSRVLLPLGAGGLLDYNVKTGDIKNISFSITMPELTELHGQVLAITSSDESVFLLLKDKSNEIVYVMAGHFITVDGVTDWSWEVLAKHTATTAVTDIQSNIWYDATRNDHHRVWYGFTDTGANETPRFLPTGDVDDDKSDGYTNDTTAEAVFLRYTGNLPRIPKHFAEVEIESKNLLASAGRQWTINHRVDDPTASFVAGDAVNTSPFQTIKFPDGLSGKMLELQAVPAMASVGTTPPEIVSVRVTAYLRPDPAKIFPMSLYLADNLYILNGTEESKTQGNLNQLNTWNGAAADLLLFTPDKADGRNVIFLPGTLRITELTKELDRRAEYRADFLLAEV